MHILSTLLLFGVLSLLALGAEDYYKLLGLKKDASEREIKKAYRVLSKKFHPDKNPGDESAHHKFVEVAEAYDALSNAETRRIYDQYGHDGLQQFKQQGGQQRQQQHDPFDLFRSFFGGSGHFGGGGGGVRKGPNMEVRLNIPLKDFYTGRAMAFSVEKQMVCEHCEGTGSENGPAGVETCDKCAGHGIVLQKHQLAPGIFQQVRAQCDKCGGQGKTVKHRCSVCGGARVVRQVEDHDVHVERGMPRGARVTIDNEADESPDWEAGDLIVHLQEEEPSIKEGKDEDGHDQRVDGVFFRRKGNDLYWREVLSLREAWMGDWSRNLTHLDGHVVRLGRPKGEVVQPNTIEVVKDEGMPIWEKEGRDGTDEFGSLIVEYIVVLPDQMDKAATKDFNAVWDKWQGKKGHIALDKDRGRPLLKDEL